MDAGTIHGIIGSGIAINEHDVYGNRISGYGMYGTGHGSGNGSGKSHD
jgi:hypothetical protein